MRELLIACGAVIFVNDVLPVINAVAEALVAKLGKLSTKDQCEAAKYAKDLESYGMANEERQPAIGFQFAQSPYFQDEEDE